MQRSFVLLTALSMLLLYSCAEKHHPAKSEIRVTEKPGAVSASPAPANKPVAVKPKVKEPVPRVIIVNDKAAKRSVDGRYYYDFEGRRYWRNKKDGKYYLFHKSMFDDPAFQP